MAKAIALGADLCGIALPFLRVLAKEGTAGVERYLDTLKADFIRALFLTGCRTVGDLKNVRYVLSGELQHWMKECSSKNYFDHILFQ
jgi:isopentenyl diphosphate isomerase/L-lactate dehydrogenase-like FMN-dependent dehydrogenase